MKPPKYTRMAKHRAIGPAPAGIHIAAVGAQVRYVGSLYHKDVPSFAGNPPQPRPDASICPKALSRQQPTTQKWLTDAVARGHFSASWENGFPRYVWHREAGVVFEGRHIAQGQYKGYPLDSDERVRGLP